MEKVEEANKLAIVSSHRVLSLSCQPQTQTQATNLELQTRDAVSKFRRVVSLLSNSSGHARVRSAKSFKSPLPQDQKLFLEAPHCQPKSSPSSLQLLPTKFCETTASQIESNWRNSLPSNPTLRLDLTPKPLLQLAQPKPSLHYHLLQQQQLQRLRLQQQQQMKYRSEMMNPHNKSGLNLKLDGSSCTQTASSGRSSFMSSLSLDGSMTSLDNSSFQVTGDLQISIGRDSTQGRRWECEMQELWQMSLFK